MIYLDSSVALATLFAEARSPPDTLWDEQLTSSRLLEYEMINRLYVRQADAPRFRLARDLLDGMVLMDLTPSVLARALLPFPVPVRTLDGLHLATMEFLRAQGQPVELATYDRQLEAAAVALGFALAPV